MKVVLNFSAGCGTRIARAEIDAKLGDLDLDVPSLAEVAGSEVVCGADYLEITVEKASGKKVLDEIEIYVPRDLKDGETIEVDGVRIRNGGRIFAEDAPGGKGWFYCKDEIEDWTDVSAPFDFGKKFLRSKLEFVFKWIGRSTRTKFFMFTEVYYDGIKIVDAFDGDLGRCGESGCHWKHAPSGKKSRTVEFR